MSSSMKLVLRVKAAEQAVVADAVTVAAVAAGEAPAVVVAVAAVAVVVEVAVAAVVAGVTSSGPTKRNTGTRSSRAK